MKFYYSYDANGTLYSVKYTLTDSSDLMTYYFTHNSRGDIVGIYNGSGELKAHYEYDAWGNVLSVTDQNGNAITSATHVGNLNPFRYRGYYYDSETGFYYLMTRYYDPVTHRFVNADGYFQSGSDILDTNMNAYCRNNPIMYYDPTGEITASEIMHDIAFNKNSKWSIKDATRKQMNMGVNLPYHGEPGSKSTDEEGNWRTYNDNSLPSYDYHNTDHGQPKYHPNPHEHIWEEKDGQWVPGPPKKVVNIEEFMAEYSPINNYNFEDVVKFIATGQKPWYEEAWDSAVHFFTGE